MRIAGIYPQKVELDAKIQHAVSEPYGLEMILAVAKQDGHEVDLFTNFKEIGPSVVPISEPELIDRVLEFRPDVAAFSLYTCQYQAGKRIAYELKKRQPKVLTVAGNRYPTYLKDAEEPFDFFVLKEGEETFRELLREMNNGQKYSDVDGISYRKEWGVSGTPQRARNFNLDSLPDALRFPVILKQVYKGISLPPLSTSPHYAVVESSRCCYNGCKFCDNEGFWGNRVTFRSPQRVINEMSSLKEQGVDIFYFMDLNFTAFPEKARVLCDEMIKRKLNASWYCMSNTATVARALEEDSDFLIMMKEAGCHKIAWGIESTSDRALERMNKSVGGEFTTTGLTSWVLQSSLEAGMINQGFYIVGFPWETEETIARDAQSLKYMPIHILNVGIFTPIVLSRFHREMMADNYVLNPDLEKHDRNTLIYNHKTLTNESVKALQAKIHEDFYKSPEYLARLKQTCRLDSRFRQAFNDYFEYTGKEVRA